MWNLNVIPALEDMSLINPVDICSSKETNSLTALLTSSVVFISQFHTVLIKEQHSPVTSLIKLSNLSRFYTNTHSAKWASCMVRHAPLMCIGTAQLFFSWLLRFSLQMKSASFNKSDKLPPLNCWPLIFPDKGVLPDFLPFVKTNCK